MSPSAPPDGPTTYSATYTSGGTGATATFIDNAPHAVERGLAVCIITHNAPT
jgi:hypothetical protein